MANLITTITESLTLNGAQQGGTTTQTITGINHVFKRIVTCVDDTDCTIATFQTATSTGDAAIDLEDVKYIRVTNLETTHPCNLSLQIAGGEGGSFGEAANNGGSAQAGGGGAGGDGAAIRRIGGYSVTINNSGTIQGDQNATGVS